LASASNYYLDGIKYTRWVALNTDITAEYVYYCNTCYKMADTETQSRQRAQYLNC